MTLTIRLASVEDIPKLQELIIESVRTLGLPYYNPRQIESALKYIFGVDTQLIMDGTYFVAEINGEIAGCGGWSKRKTLFGGDQSKESGPDLLLEPGNDAARIRAFYVRPHWARKGVGKQIIKDCEQAARNAGFQRIELVATLPGEPLYSALGYSITTPTRIETPDGEALPAFLMAKNL